jgi:hypothetical protein
MDSKFHFPLTTGCGDILVTDGGEGVCVDPGEKGWKPGGPARQEREKAGSWLQTVEEDRRVARWPRTQETGSWRETFMHRVSVIVHRVAVIQYDHNRNRVSLYCLFQENKSFGTEHHLHSSSDVREVVSSTILYTSRLLKANI